MNTTELQEKRNFIYQVINDDNNEYLLEEIIKYIKQQQKAISEIKIVKKISLSPLVASMFTGKTTKATDEEIDNERYEYLKEKYK